MQSIWRNFTASHTSCGTTNMKDKSKQNLAHSFLLFETTRKRPCFEDYHIRRMGQAYCFFSVLVRHGTFELAKNVLQLYMRREWRERERERERESLRGNNPNSSIVLMFLNFHRKIIFQEIRFDGSWCCWSLVVITGGQLICRWIIAFLGMGRGLFWLWTNNAHN